jgi:hypothetical protein
VPVVTNLPSALPRGATSLVRTVGRTPRSPSGGQWRACRQLQIGPHRPVLSAPTLQHHMPTGAWASSWHMGCTFARVCSTILIVVVGAALALPTGDEQLTVRLVHVKSGAELLDALNRTEVQWIGLRGKQWSWKERPSSASAWSCRGMRREPDFAAGDIFLTEAEAHPYELPLIIGSNRSITLAPGERGGLGSGCVGSCMQPP